MKHQSENYKFFRHRDCEFFPCHKTEEPEKFNCLFCYCPLYALGEDCGGGFTYTKEGIKDCSSCIIPHSQEGYDYIMENFSKVFDLARKKE